MTTEAEDAQHYHHIPSDGPGGRPVVSGGTGPNGLVPIHRGGGDANPTRGCTSPESCTEQVDIVSMGQDATRAVENGDTHSEGADGYDTEALLTYFER